MSSVKKLRVAFIYDRINKFGGAEQVLLALHTLWPDAPLFTAFYNPKKAPWAHGFHVIPSCINSLPFVSSCHEYFPWLTPMAFESFSFDDFDVVISVTSAEAKSIITKPGTLHICYCLTPTRYLWSGYDFYLKNSGFGFFSRIASYFFKLWAPVLRSWDIQASHRPDRYVAISEHVKKRIEKYYHHTVDRVLYPPVKTKKYGVKAEPKGNVPVNTPVPYYLFVSRLVPYKRADIVIAAAQELGRTLVVIGQGSDLAEIKKHAHKNVIIIDRYLTDEELVLYHRNCRAFLFAGEEDFGIVAAEAQAAGKPVIAYRDSGVSEIIIDGVTGVLFDRQTKESLIGAIQKFERMNVMDPVKIKNNASRFDETRFFTEFRSYIEDSYKEYNTTI